MSNWAEKLTRIAELKDEVLTEEEKEHLRKEREAIYDVDQMELVYKDQALWKQELNRKQKQVAGKFSKQLTERELEEYREIFRLVDTDNSEEIDREELTIMMKTLGLDASPESVNKVFDEVDTDGSGDISFQEFVSCMQMTVDVEYSARELKKAFRNLVTTEEDKGSLYTNSLVEAIQVFSDLSEKQIQDLVTTVDDSNKGSFHFLKLVNMLSSTTREHVESNSVAL